MFGHFSFSIGDHLTFVYNVFCPPVSTLCPSRPQHTATLKSMKSILRWLAVLPVAIVAAIMVSFPLHWLVRLLCQNSPEAYLTDSNGVSLLYLHRDEIERFLQPIASYFAFVLAGARTAPKFHFIAAVVLCCLLLVSLAFSIYHVTYYDDSLLSFHWRMAFGPVGAILSLWIVWANRSKWSPPAS